MKITKHFNLLDEGEKSQVVAEVRVEVNNDVMSQADQIRKGKHCYNYVNGRIFSDDERAEIEDSEKVPVEATEGIVKLSSMMGHIMDASREGLVVGNGPEDAANAEIRQAILKDDVATNSGLERIRFQVYQDVLVTGVPTWAFLENSDAFDVAKPGLSISYAPWDSVIPNASWRDSGLRGLSRLTRVQQMTYEELVEKFFDGMSVPEVKQYENVANKVAGRDAISADFLTARNGENVSSAGLVNVMETLRMVYTDIPVSIGQDPNDIIHLPLDMTEEQKMAHAQETGRTIGSQRDKVLWSTIWTNSGLLLDHAPHWFQAGGWPASCYIPASMDGQWCGIFEFTLDSLKMLSYLYTEQLQGVRTVTNNVVTAIKGAVTDKDEAVRQLRKAGGFIEMAANMPRDAIGFLQNQRESQAFSQAIDTTRDILDRLTVERNFEGGAQASQESSKAIGARINAGLSKLGYFLHGAKEFDRQLMRAALLAIPYAYPDYRAVRLFDKRNGDMAEVGVNEPADFDWMGNVIRSVNRLDSGTWDYIFTETDNSVSGREQARAIYLEFMKNFGNMPPENLEVIALAYPNSDVQEMGKRLKEAREAAQKAPPPPPPVKVNATLDLASLGAQAVQQIAEQAHLLPPPPPPPPPQQGPPGQPMGGPELPPAQQGQMEMPPDLPGQMNPPEMG